MKVLKSSHINPFGGLNFVLHEFDRLKLGDLLCQNLPKLPSQSKYSWKDILSSKRIKTKHEFSINVDINDFNTKQLIYRWL
jgi:hypothetical protein